jgi:hypothetical protein
MIPLVRADPLSALLLWRRMGLRQIATRWPGPPRQGPRHLPGDVFVAESAYLDDRPAAPLRFLAEANLNMMIRQRERDVDRDRARHDLDEDVALRTALTFRALAPMRRRESRRAVSRCLLVEPRYFR